MSPRTPMVTYYMTTLRVRVWPLQYTTFHTPHQVQCQTNCYPCQPTELTNPCSFQCAIRTLLLRVFAKWEAAAIVNLAITKKRGKHIAASRDVPCWQKNTYNGTYLLICSITFAVGAATLKTATLLCLQLKSTHTMLVPWDAYLHLEGSTKRAAQPIHKLGPQHRYERGPWHDHPRGFQ